MLSGIPKIRAVFSGGGKGQRPRVAPSGNFDLAKAKKVGY